PRVVIEPTAPTEISPLSLHDALPISATVQGSFQGTAQIFQSSLSNMPVLLAAALLTVYIVLGMLYESLIHPITILSTLPSAGVGDRKSTRLNSSHDQISYAVFCLDNK